MLMVHFSGFYAWLKEPLSARALEDARQIELIQQAWADSGKFYGYRKLTDDLLLDDMTCTCCQTSAAVTGDGTVLLAYRDRTVDEVRDISVVGRMD
jgi:hypothetical protein